MEIGTKLSLIEIMTIVETIVTVQCYCNVLNFYRTKIDDKLPNNLFKIDGYKFIRFDRTRHGGGVAVYCRDSFKSRVREDIPKTSLEMIGVEITPLRAAPFIILSL